MHSPRILSSGHHLAVPKIFIDCPVTDRPLPTGYNLETLDDLPSNPHHNRIVCRYCGEAHEWTREDAYFPEEEESS